MKNYIFGAGGHGKVVCDTLQASGLTVAGFVDSNSQRREHFGLPVVTEDALPKSEAFGLVVAIGVNHVRAALAARLSAAFPKMIFINAVHPSASIAKSAKLGVGNVIAAGAILGADAALGDHCVLNTGAQADHDCVISSGVSLAPGVILGGGVKVGKMSYIALGAKVIHGISIGSHTVIGAGSVVVRTMADNVVGYGSPCKVVRSRRDDDKYL